MAGEGSGAEKAEYTKKLFVMGIGASQLGFLVAGGLLGGLWVDERFDTSPLFGFVGLIGGFASGVLLLVRLVKMANRQEKNGAH